MIPLDVRYVDYGYEFALETRLFNSMIAGTMLPYIEEGDICVGHSNGCAIIYELMCRNAPIRGAIFINGALSQTFARHAHVEFIDVFYNNGDYITEAAKFGAAVGIVDKDWGALGHAGYIGNDPNITNFDCGATPDMPVVSGHSDIFTPPKIMKWGPFIAARVKAKISP